MWLCATHKNCLIDFHYTNTPSFYAHTTCAFVCWAKARRTACYGGIWLYSRHSVQQQPCWSRSRIILFIPTYRAGAINRSSAVEGIACKRSTGTGAMPDEGKALRSQCDACRWSRQILLIIIQIPHHGKCEQPGLASWAQQHRHLNLPACWNIY